MIGTSQAIEAIRATLALRDDLRRKPWRGSVNPMAGHCYVAAEALYHATGGARNWRVCRVRHEGATHWFLRNRHTGYVVDPTADQFATRVPYHKSVATGFLTKQPSARARVVLETLPW